MAGFDLNQPINWDEIDDLEGVMEKVLEKSAATEMTTPAAEQTPATERRPWMQLKPQRRHYPPDMKRSIYALCLERSTNGIIKEGVTKSVANDMRVGKLWRVVQRVWQDG
uniref:DUF7769 domain-containing protein n=1 Tax=Oryza glumipatula TaxID=40148 RepID=A0A0E0ASG8_9ORYZ